MVKNNILCVGLNPSIDISCKADHVEPVHKVRTRDANHDPGGGAINVARVIGVLGGKAELAYFSGGTTGPMFEKLLEAYQIAQHRFAIEEAVRVAYMVRDEATGLEYRFVPEGPHVTADELEPLMTFVERSDCAYFVASGSLPRGVPTDCYAQMADMSRKKGARFILDTSGEALHEAFARGGIYLAKPSKHELELFAGHSLDADGLHDAAIALIARGCVENLVVSLGSEGALLANADGVLQLPSISVEARSAVGAGDSFVAAMTWQLSQGKPVVDAFRFGVAAGAAAVMTSGTQLCRRSDVQRLFEQLKQAPG